MQQNSKKLPNESVTATTVPIQRNPILKSTESQTDPIIGKNKIQFRNTDSVPTYLKPYHIRLKEYRAAKFRIFNEQITSEIIVERSRRSTRRLREFWRKVLKNRKCIVSAVISDRNKFDLRPFASVRIFDQEVVRMIDTGATVSCFASNYARKFLDENRGKYEKLNAFLKTADGSQHTTVGRVTTTVTFRGLSREIQFFIIPNLTQNLYLGIDFVRAFSLARDLFADSSKPVGIKNIDEIDCGGNVHRLNLQERKQLEDAINSFNSYSKMGLGRTSLVTHNIDTGENKPIKQRHFAISPAVERLLFEEIDRMISLGVIEESQSPWSSPVALVVKPGKVRLCLDARKLNCVTVRISKCSARFTFTYVC